ncbi:MAG: DUF1697 domain-containing protein [Sphingorhabdus sp.]
MKWIALFRGINVGGNNKLPMAELRELASELGFDDPKTYIQSGNLVFGSEKSAFDLEKILGDAVEKRFGFRAQIIIRNADALIAALDANPFHDRVTEGKQLHLFFLDEPASRYNEAKLRDLAVESEDFALIGDIFYLFAPEGIGRSRLAEKMGPYFPKRMTARNLNSVQALCKLARS